MATKTKYPEVRGYMKSHYGILLTDEQIETIAKRDEITARDILDDCTDSLPRDIFIDEMVLLIMGKRRVPSAIGKRYHWPLNGDSDEYYHLFMRSFPGQAIKKGFRLSKKIWGSAAG